MLRHTGHRRNFKHNIRLAALLCLTAGFVNTAGLLAFAVLTTNVTGHAAYFAESVAQADFRLARMIGLWMLLFLSGAFVSSFVIGKIGRNQVYAYTLPILLEIGILAIVGISGDYYDGSVLKKELFAGSLLFAMGLQNGMVSVISGSVVRTTHLTGMFTDLGIELAGLIQAENTAKKGFLQKISLRLAVILFFLTGAVAGGFVFPVLHYAAFFVPVGLLVIAMFYDISRVRLLRLVHQVRKRQ